MACVCRPGAANASPPALRRRTRPRPQPHDKKNPKQQGKNSAAPRQKTPQQKGKNPSAPRQETPQRHDINSAETRQKKIRSDTTQKIRRDTTKRTRRDTTQKIRRDTTKKIRSYTTKKSEETRQQKNAAKNTASARPGFGVREGVPERLSPMQAACPACRLQADRTRKAPPSARSSRENMGALRPGPKAEKEIRRRLKFRFISRT